MRAAACGGYCRKKRSTGNKTLRHSGPVLASNSRPRIAQRFLPLPVLAPILRERDALRFLPSLAGAGLRMGVTGEGLRMGAIEPESRRLNVLGCGVHHNDGENSTSSSFRPPSRNPGD